MNKVKNKLRVCHFPQVGSLNKAFIIEVADEIMAAKIVHTLAYQHLWLEKNNVIPDYCNAIIVEMYNTDIDPENQPNAYGWENYYNEEESMEWNELEETYFKDGELIDTSLRDLTL